MTVEQGCVLWGTRVILILSLKGGVLQELRNNQPGTVNMTAVARSYVWWLCVDSQIIGIILSDVDRYILQ